MDISNQLFVIEVILLLQFIVQLAQFCFSMVSTPPTRRESEYITI